MWIRETVPSFSGSSLIKASFTPKKGTRRKKERGGISGCEGRWEQRNKIKRGGDPRKWNERELERRDEEGKRKKGKGKEGRGEGKER